MLKPEDFANTVLDDAYRLRQLVMARNSSGTALDEKNSVWLVTMDAWRDLLKSQDISPAIEVQTKRLMGIPVRITIDDEPDTPRIQLLMEPMLLAR